MFLGRLTFLVPCGFQCSDWCWMQSPRLVVRPIQRDFLCLISVLHWVLVGCPPQLIVSDDVWPEDPEDGSEAAIDEGLHSFHVGLSGAPGFRAVQQDCFHIGVEDS